MRRGEVKMARIAIEIDFEKCPSFKGTLQEEVYTKFYAENIQESRKGLVALKGTMVKLIKSTIKTYEGYSKELFGKVKYIEDELEQKEYLISLIK